jgi:hypothetical protein
MTQVTWFNNGHEHRNDWLRFGLMRLHVNGSLRFRERPLSSAPQFGFSESVVAHEHRHTSVLLVDDGSRKVRVVVDSEDSFFWMSPLVAHADVYFCAGFNREFFADRKFGGGFPWQTEIEIEFYRRKALNLIEEHGEHFHRVRPFAPIGPNLSRPQARKWPEQKARNLYHRAASLIGKDTPWILPFLDFEARYADLLSLRKEPVRHDVVLLDTLWGWPRHRVALHERLKQLAGKGYDIHSRLRWQDPVDLDGGTSFAMDQSAFPIESGSIGDYEKMLAASRLGVFATGFHFGWRNIVTLAMMLGLPVYCDPFMIDHRQSYDDYALFKNDPGDWERIEALLLHYRNADLLSETKRRNQRFFDQNLAPEVIARHLIADALASDRPPRARDDSTVRQQPGQMA